MTKTGMPGDPDPREAAEEAFDPGYRQFDCTGNDPAITAEACEAARQAIKDGECIVLPTDTVYGIGADAFSAEAVQRLLDAKKRGRDMPPPVLISEPALIRTLAVDIPETAHALVDKHWPGALTVICRIQPSLRMDLGDTKGTIALRVPDHELARDVLRRTGPMAVSSANISGQPAALSCDEAIQQLGDSVSVYLDGGPLDGPVGAPSTIVDFTQHEDGEVLRRGAISIHALREIAPNLRDRTDEAEVGEGDRSTGSGPTGEDWGHEEETSATKAEDAGPIDADSGHVVESSGRNGDGPPKGSDRILGAGG
ncbi:MAG TPA: L-threonylcarbamoyladenylate synthase [Propionibacteriaceae bacterium]|nr:L-threonylcarbamoyladenylate synthase [Propionibacteriaceae bacterium]